MSSPINFAVCYSVWRLLLFTTTSLAFVIPLSYVLINSNGSFGWSAQFVIMAGLLFFGGSLFWFVTRLFNRRAINIDSEGIVIHEWSQDVIPHKSIKHLRDGGSHLGLWLHRPSRFPPSTFMGKMRQKIGMRFKQNSWGDIYAVTLLYDHRNDDIIRAMDALRPQSAFEQNLAKLIAEPETGTLNPE